MQTPQTPVPQRAKFEVPTLGQWIVLSSPAYLGETREETPYQWLQVCDADDRCETLCDLRGSGGVSMSAEEKLAFSPDRLYFLVLRMTGVDAEAKKYRSQYYEIYGVRERGPVTFQTEAGKQATTDNIHGWLPHRPHALEISTGWQKKAEAFLAAG